MSVKKILLFPFKLALTIITLLSVGTLMILVFPLFIVYGMMNGSADEGVTYWYNIIIDEYMWITDIWFN